MFWDIKPFENANTLGKGNNSIILPLDKSKYLGRLSSLDMVWQPV